MASADPRRWLITRSWGETSQQEREINPKMVRPAISLRGKLTFGDDADSDPSDRLGLPEVRTLTNRLCHSKLDDVRCRATSLPFWPSRFGLVVHPLPTKIGRASCRERG